MVRYRGVRRIPTLTGASGSQTNQDDLLSLFVISSVVISNKQSIKRSQMQILSLPRIVEIMTEISRNFGVYFVLQITIIMKY